MKVLADSGSESPLPGSGTAVLSLCPHAGEGARVLSGVSLRKQHLSHRWGLLPMGGSPPRGLGCYHQDSGDSVAVCESGGDTQHSVCGNITEKSFCLFFFKASPGDG